jgi:hypothetical protein
MWNKFKELDWLETIGAGVITIIAFFVVAYFVWWPLAQLVWRVLTYIL